MTVPDHDRGARLALSQCMLDILRPCTPYDAKVTLNERLIGYAIATGVYGDSPLGVGKLADMTGLPKSTVRSVLKAITARGWVERQADKTYIFTEDFERHADERFQLGMKYATIVRTAETLRGRV